MNDFHLYVPLCFIPQCSITSIHWSSNLSFKRIINHSCSYEYNARQRKELVIDTPFLFKYVQWIGNCFLSCRWILVRRFIFKGFFALLRYVVGRKPFTHTLRWSWELYRSCNLSFKVHNQGIAKNITTNYAYISKNFYNYLKV